MRYVCVTVCVRAHVCVWLVIKAGARYISFFLSIQQYSVVTKPFPTANPHQRAGEQAGAAALYPFAAAAAVDMRAVLGRGIKFTKLTADTPEALKAAAEKRAARKKLLARYLDVRNLDIFGYEPDYTFPGYRSRFGACTSVLLALAVLLRICTRFIDFLYPEAVISENKLLFPRDMQAHYELPKFGFVFKKAGWQPFYDPTYFTFGFEQGYSGRASNSSYTDLGDQTCSFVDTHGRIIEDEARCPDLTGSVVGNFFDDKFRFIHVSVNRCHNGTDAQGRAQPGPCRRPDEIDDLIYQGTVTMAIAQTDLDVAATEEYSQLVTLKRQFKRHWHATYDLYFTVRQVDIQPRAFFDSLDVEQMQRRYVVLERDEASFTDFRPAKIGKWNKADPTYVPQYAAFFLMLSEERIDQQRSFLSAFELVESWGASVCFFYILFRLLAHRWNAVHFLQQIKGLDLRDLTRDQFNQFGKLVDKSFQVPREMQDLHVRANVQ